MDALGLYNAVLAAYPYGGFAVCDLHKPCKSSIMPCRSSTSKNLIDFDSVEREYDKVNKLASRPSVDAIVTAGDKFCFLEIKGWLEFLRRNIPTKIGIKKQATAYNLKDKYATSKEICGKIVCDEHIFESIPEVFILVTDIDVEKQGVESFQYNLMALAETGTDWQTFCNRSLNAQLNKQITTVPKFYVDCRHLEATLKEIKAI